MMVVVVVVMQARAFYCERVFKSRVRCSPRDVNNFKRDRSAALPSDTANNTTTEDDCFLEKKGFAPPSPLLYFFFLRHTKKAKRKERMATRAHVYLSSFPSSGSSDDLVCFSTIPATTAAT